MSYCFGRLNEVVLDLLGVHESYQRQGIGASLIKWGTDQGKNRLLI